MPVKRAAHRPSRKHAVVQAAMRLHAAGPVAPVTVADIAAEAKMTAAAVYYHYATKEDIIVEGLTAFASAISDEVSSFLRDENASPADLPMHLLDWLEQDRDAAAVWFAYSNGLSTEVEAVRRATNEVIIAELVRSLKAHHPEFSLPHASVVAAALISAIEISARAWLVSEDALVQGREDEFRGALAALGAKILASPPPVRRV
jgi:AcrR family transcriptional regulator